MPRAGGARRRGGSRASAHGYHAITFGWLVGEVVRRVDGRSLGRYFRDEVARPLGADFHIGLPDAEHARVAEMSAIPLPEPGGEGMSLAALDRRRSAEPRGARVPESAVDARSAPTLPEWRRAEIPGANGHATRARHRAHLRRARVRRRTGRRARCSRAQASSAAATSSRIGPDHVLQISTRVGQGFMLSQDAPLAALRPEPAARSATRAPAARSASRIPTRRVGFGYVMNRMGPHILLDPRADALIDAVYALARLAPPCLRALRNAPDRPIGVPWPR